MKLDHINTRVMAMIIKKVTVRIRHVHARGTVTFLFIERDDLMANSTASV